MTPDPKHIEAVGEAMAAKPFAYYRGAYRHDPDTVVSYLKRAERILTSTDPVVLDAMQDALVRAGRLEVETQATWRLPSRRLHARWYPESYVDDILAQEAEHPEPLNFQKVIRRRLVADWAEAGDE